MCSKRRVNSISLFVERATFRTSKFQNLRKTKNIVVAKKKRYSKKCQKSICYFQLDNPSANNMKNKRIERYKNDNFVHHRFSLKILIGKTWESDYHKNCDGQLRDAKKIPDNLTLNRRRDVWRINSTLIQKKEKKKHSLPQCRGTQHIFPNEIPWQYAARGGVEKTGIGGNKAKNDENGSVFLRTWWPDTDKFWGRGTNVSQRRHCASFIRAEEAQRGRREKKKLSFHFRAADS